MPRLLKFTPDSFTSIRRRMNELGFSFTRLDHGEVFVDNYPTYRPNTNDECEIQTIRDYLLESYLKNTGRLIMVLRRCEMDALFARAMITSDSQHTYKLSVVLEILHKLGYAPSVMRDDAYYLPGNGGYVLSDEELEIRSWLCNQGISLLA